MRLSFSSRGGQVIKTTDKGSTVIIDRARRSVEARPAEKLARGTADEVLAVGGTDLLQPVRLNGATHQAPGATGRVEGARRPQGQALQVAPALPA